MLNQDEIKGNINQCESDLKMQLAKFEKVNADINALNEQRNQLIAEVQLLRGALGAYKLCVGQEQENQPNQVTE